MKKFKRALCVFLAACMLMSLLCFTASAKSGTYNNRTYKTTLSLTRRAMTSKLTYPTSIQLGFLGYGESSLGSGYAKVSCANNRTGTSVTKTVNPPNDSLQFYYAYQEYYCDSHLMTTDDRSLSKL